MDDLIEALTIFKKYVGNIHKPTICAYDNLVIAGAERSQMDEKDVARLQVLGFEWDELQECFYSYRFG